MIAFVILHYQAIEETIQCVMSIKKNVRDKRVIIIVDNASPNQTGKRLSRIFENDNEIKLILNSSNVGFAKGNNIGFKEAKKYNPSFVVVLNSDTIIKQNNFSELVNEAYEKYSFDVMGPDIYSTKTHSHQNPQKEKNYSLKELKKKQKWLLIKNKLKWMIKLKYMLIHSPVHNTNFSQKTPKLQVGQVLHGAFYVFSSKFINVHNECFYHGTFMYYESYILHFLGMRENMIFLYYPNIQVEHHEDVSTDMTYNTIYKKSIFTNKCLLDSCEEFIKIQKNENIRIG